MSEMEPTLKALLKRNIGPNLGESPVILCDIKITVGIPAHPPDLLAGAHQVATTVDKETLDSRVGEEEEGAEGRRVLEECGVPVGPDKEDKQLEKVLEVGVKHALGDADLGGEQRPVVLVVEAVDDADGHELDGEGRHGDDG